MAWLATEREEQGRGGSRYTHSKHEIASHAKPDLDVAPRNVLAVGTEREASGVMRTETDGIRRTKVDGKITQRYEIGYSCTTNHLLSIHTY
jgi:hypothetical protein